MQQTSLKQAWQAGIFFKYADVEKVLLADLAGYEGRRDPAIRGNQEVAGMYALIGEHGCGKSTFIKDFAIKHMLPLRILCFGEKEPEDALGIPSTGEGQEHHTVLAPPEFPCEVPETGRTGPKDVLPGRDISGTKFPGKGILWVNEFCTADNKQESQLRSLISERRIGDNLGADGWRLVGDTNPLDSKYQTVNKMDESVEARIHPFCVRPSYEETLEYWRVSGVLPGRGYGFLRMNKSLWDMADNRKWTTTFDRVACIEANIPHETANKLCIRLLELHVGTAVGQAYLNYTIHGDDPNYYPLTANEYLEASEEEHHTHLARITTWSQDEDSRSLLQNTLYDIHDWMSDEGREFRDQHAERISKVVQVAGLSSAAMVMENMPRPLQKLVMQHVQGTEFERRLIQLQRADAQRRIGQ